MTVVEKSRLSTRTAGGSKSTTSRQAHACLGGRPAGGRRSKRCSLQRCLPAGDTGGLFCRTAGPNGKASGKLMTRAGRNPEERWPPPGGERTN